MKKISLIMALSLIVILDDAAAQTRGFMETFQTETVAHSWVHRTDGSTYLPVWTNDANPYIWGSFMSTPAYLYANSGSSGAKLVGDYVSARIAALGAVVYVDYPDEVYAVDVYFYSNYDHKFYCYGFWAFTDTDWHSLTAPLDATDWWVSGTGYTSVPSQALAQVAEAGIIAYPVNNLPQDTYVNLDDFCLVPQLISPSLTIDVGVGQTDVHFWGEQGQSYTAKFCDNLVTQNWQIATGCENIVGLNCGITVHDSGQRSNCFYRLTSVAHYFN